MIVMPVTGRKQKPEDQRRNTTKPVFEWVEVEDTPYTGWRPKCPSNLHASARRWWEVVSRMPHCRLWTKTDWDFALETIVIVDAFYNGQVSQAAELRLRSKILGLTFDARRDLRIRYVKPGKAKLAPVHDMAADPRARLRAAADESAS